MQAPLMRTTYAFLGGSYLWPFNLLITATVFVIDRLSETPTLLRLYSSLVMIVCNLVTFAGSTTLAMYPRDFGFRVRLGEVIIAASFIFLSLAWVSPMGPVFFFTSILITASGCSFGASFSQHGLFAITQRIDGGDEARALLLGQGVTGLVSPMIGLALATTGADLSKYTTLMFLSPVVLSLYVLYLFRGPQIEEHIQQAVAEEVVLPPLSELKLVLYKIRDPALAIFLSFMVTLVYPVFANGLTSPDVSRTVLTSLAHISWCSGDFISRLVCLSPTYQIKDGPTLVRYSLARFGILAVLVMLSVLGNPSVFLYLLVMLFYGFTAGHIISSCVSYAPFCVPHSEQPAAGGILGMMFSAGLVAGALTSLLFVPLVR